MKELEKLKEDIAFDPYENYSTCDSDVLKLIAVIEKQNAALEYISKSKYGLDGNETNEELSEHWAKRAIDYENQARKTLSEVGELLKGLEC